MNAKTITCIGCPLGCRLSVLMAEGQVRTVDGAGCGRGAAYARQECVCPTRMVTSLVRVQGRRAPLSVKTVRPVPKEKIFACLEEIHRARVTSPVRSGDVIVKDVCGTGVDVVATGAVENADGPESEAGAGLERSAAQSNRFTGA